MDTVERLLLIRAGHAVKRCHTERVIGEYTVGQHSAGVAALLLAFGHCSAEVLAAALYHDVPEAVFGDVPAPAKWRNGRDVQAALDRMEHKFLKKSGLLQKLSGQEHAALYLADKMELMFYCAEQRAMGNALVDGMFWAVVHRLEEKGAVEGAPARAQELFIYLLDHYPPEK